MLDEAEVREVGEMVDVLVEMRRQGRTGSILPDGRKNVKKWPMVNFIFKSTMGTFLVS